MKTPPEFQSPCEEVISYVKDAVAKLSAFARKYENNCWAICFMFIKNRRKRPVHLGIVSKSLWLLCLLYGRKEIQTRLNISGETIRQWNLAVGVGTMDKLEEIFEYMSAGGNLWDWEKKNT